MATLHKGRSSSRMPVRLPEQVHIPLNEFIEEGLAIQHRFVAEPVFAKTGVGFMRSAGVSEIKQAQVAKKSKPGGR